MKKYILLLMLLLILSACKKQQENIDEDTANEYVNIFLQDDNITTYDRDGKESLALLLFGMDGCSSCFKMERLISEKNEISSIIQNHYLPYYINLSRKKQWIMNKQIISIEKLKNNFNIVGVPFLVIMYGDKILFKYPGIMEKDKLKYIVTFFLDKELYKYDEKTIYEKLLSTGK